MPIGSSLGVTLPTQGGNTGTWGTDLNTEINKILTAVEAQVPVSAIDISADLDFNTNGITGLTLSAYENQASNPTDLSCVFFDVNGDLAIRNGDNVVVAITSGSGLSGAGGSVTGAGYGANGIEVNWDATRFNFFNAAGVYSPVRANSYILHDNTANSVTVDVPTVSTSYNLTLPSAVAAGATTILQSDASGNTSWSNSFSTDITLTGTAELKHGSRTIQIHASGGTWDGTRDGSTDPYIATLGTGQGEYYANTAKDSFLLPIPLADGCRITDMVAYISGGNGLGKIAHLRYKSATNESISTATNGSSVTNTDTGATTLEWTGLSHTIGTSGSATEFVWVEFVSVHENDTFLGLRVTYDRP